MHPDATLHRMAELVIASEVADPDISTVARRQLVKLASAVIRARDENTVIPFPRRQPDQPETA
jgi:hypothetical protein